MGLVGAVDRLALRLAGRPLEPAGFPARAGVVVEGRLGGSFHESDQLEYNSAYSAGVPQPPKWEADGPKCNSNQHGLGGAFYDTGLEQVIRSDAGSIRYVVGSKAASVDAPDFSTWREECQGAATTAGFGGFPNGHWEFDALSPPPLAKLTKGDTGKDGLTTTCTRRSYATRNDGEWKAFFVVRVQLRYIPPSQLSAATTALRKVVGNGEVCVERGVLDQFRDVFYGANASRGAWPSFLPKDGCHRPN